MLNKTQQRSYVDDTWPGKDQEILNTSAYYHMSGQGTSFTMNYMYIERVHTTL